MRQLSAECRYDEAAQIGQALLSRIDAEQRGHHSILIVLHQELATIANHRIEHQTAMHHAQRAETYIDSTDQTGDFVRSLVRQNLAVALAGLRQYDQAESEFTRVVSTLQGLGSSLALANALLARGQFALRRGDTRSGLTDLRQAVEVIESDDHARADPSTRAPYYIALADAHRRVLALEEADHWIALARASDPDYNTVLRARILIVEANIAVERGNFEEALGLIEQAGEIAPVANNCDRALGVDVASLTGSIRLLRREVPEARQAFNRSLQLIEALGFRNDPRNPETVYGLANVNGLLGDIETSNTLFEASAAGYRSIFGDLSEAEALVRVEQALVLSSANRHERAIESASEAMRLLEQIPTARPLSNAYAQAVIGLSYWRSGQFDLAQPQLERALADFESLRDEQSFDLVPGLQALGEIALAQGDTAVAESRLRRAYDISRTWGNETGLLVGSILSTLARVSAANNDRQSALAWSDRAVGVVAGRASSSPAISWRDRVAEQRESRQIVETDMEMLLAEQNSSLVETADEVVARLSRDSQLANATVTGASVAQMAQRLSLGDSEIALLLRQRTNLTNQLISVETEINRLLTPNSIAVNNDMREQLFEEQRSATDGLRAIDASILAIEPRFRILTNNETVNIDAIASRLEDREALLQITPTTNATFVTVVTRSNSFVVRSNVSEAEAEIIVETLRASLDQRQWTDQQLQSGFVPDYDSQAAFELFDRLLSTALSRLSDIDSLIIVADGPFASLPLGILLTEQMAAAPRVIEDYASAPWLIHDFAFTYFPSVGSFAFLRDVREMPQGQAMLGIGNPSFGAANSDRIEPDEALSMSANNRLADPTFLNALHPLPETESELRRISQSVAAPRTLILVGTDATETNFRNLELEDFGMLAFATHAFTAGDVSGYAEAGIVLTPPVRPSRDDDGFLAASEISSLSLDAQWVILSACNTAEGDGTPNARPLSGLARAFFYAGARSLLVSHWAVETQSASFLSVETVGRSMGQVPPAQALQEAKLELISNGQNLARTHPYFWGAFVLVGDTGSPSS